MEVLISVVIVGAFIVVLLLLIYLIDRVNTIERETRGHKSHAPAQAVKLGPYAGLGGRKLWDAMVAQPPAGVDAAEWASVRDRYALLLQLHIESLFAEGQKDAQMGVASQPKNPRVIATPDGGVESWLPPDPVQTIYQSGCDSVQQTGEALMGVRATLNESAKSLYSQVGLVNAPVQSDLLLPGPLPQPVYWDQSPPASTATGEMSPPAPPAPPGAAR